MSIRSLDVISIGSCYIDTNAEQYPFDDAGIPVETELVGGAYETVPGGSAVNFCLLLQKLGLTSAFIGMVGNDDNGDMLQRLLEQRGVRPALIRNGEASTNTSFNMTNPSGKHIMLVAGTANAALHPNNVLPKLEEVVDDAAMLYLGGCFKLKTLAPGLGRIADVAERHDVKLVVDHNRIPKDVSSEMLSAVGDLVLRAQYYFPSREEFCELWKVETIEEGLRVLHDRAPDLVAVVKDGANGAYYWADGSMQHAPAVKVEAVANATGAGDSFNAGVMAALVGGRSLADAVAHGCKVAAAKITHSDLPALA